MEMKDRRAAEETLRHGDVRMPEITGLAAGGPSRARVMLHLAGMGLGFLLLLVGLGLGLSTGVWNRLALIPAIVGGALVAGWITINYQFLSAMIKNRRVMVGTNALFMSLLAMVLIALLNFISYRHYSKWDMTSVGLNTLSPKTTQILEGLEADINILVSDRAGGPRSPFAEAYARLQQLLRLYREESDRVRVETLSPDVDPQQARLLLERYGIDTDPGSLFDDVFVVCGGKSKQLALRDMVEFAPNPANPYGRQVMRAFKGEQYITSALLEVTSERQPKLYFLAGHGERSISDAEPGGMLDLAGALKRDYFALEEMVGVPDTGVPEDCDCLVIFDPRVPLAPEEVAAVERYLDDGGRVLACLDFEGRSGLEELLKRRGVEVGQDIIISQDARTLGSPAAFITANFGDHEITEPLRRYQVAFNFARSVSASTTHTAKVVTLVSSSGNSFAETDLEEMRTRKTATFAEDEDMKGPISVAVAVEDLPPAGGRGTSEQTGALGRMVIFGDADVFSNNLLSLSMLFRNLDLCRNSINWLVERRELIAIEPQAEKQHIFVVDAAGRRAVFWLMVVALPLVVLLLGGVVWAVRSYGSRSK